MFWKRKQLNNEKQRLIDAITKLLDTKYLSMLIDDAKNKQCDDLEIIFFLNSAEQVHLPLIKPFDYLLCYDNPKEEEFECLRPTTYKRRVSDDILALHAFTELNVSKGLYKKRNKWITDIKNALCTRLDELNLKYQFSTNLMNLNEQDVEQYKIKNMKYTKELNNGLRRYDIINIFITIP